MARNPYEFRHQILNVFFPARDSTAIVFGNVLFELAQHSHIWDELRAEVTSFGPYQQFMFELLEELKTTESIISETLCMAHRACCAQRYRTTNRRRTRWALAAIRTERPSRRHGTLHPTTDPRMWEDDAEKLVLGLGVMVGLCGKRIGNLLVRLAQELSAVRNSDEVLEHVEEISITIESRNGVNVSLIPAELKTLGHIVDECQ